MLRAQLLSEHGIPRIPGRRDQNPTCQRPPPPQVRRGAAAAAAAVPRRAPPGSPSAPAAQLPPAAPALFPAAAGPAAPGGRHPAGAAAPGPAGADRAAPSGGAGGERRGPMRAARRRRARPAAPLPRPGRAGMRRPPPAPVPSPPAEHAHGPQQQGGGGGRPAVGAERQRVGAHAGGARFGGCRCLAAAAGEESFARPPAPGRRGARPAVPPRPPRAQGAGFGCSEPDLASGPGATRPAPPRGAPSAGRVAPARPRRFPAAEEGEPQPSACREKAPMKWEGARTETREWWGHLRAPTIQSVSAVTTPWEGLCAPQTWPRWRSGRGVSPVRTVPHSEQLWQPFDLRLVLIQTPDVMYVSP